LALLFFFQQPACLPALDLSHRFPIIHPATVAVSTSITIWTGIIEVEGERLSTPKVKAVTLPAGRRLLLSLAFQRIFPRIDETLTGK
jgi:hypothetical protein